MRNCEPQVFSRSSIHHSWFEIICYGDARFDFPDALYHNNVSCSMLQTDEGIDKLAREAAANVRGIIGFIKQRACEVTVVITSVLTTVEEIDVFTWPNRQELCC